MKRARSRAFTLVELMVAMVAAMFVAISVFALAKHASAFAMRQSRVADATLQSVMGFERLQADIARAGFLSSPNVVRDPAICRNVTALYPAQLGRLASIFIDPVPPAQLSTESSANELAPNRITLSGSYDSADLFVARQISQVGNPVVTLSRTSLGMANIGYTPATGGADLGRVFKPNRALRILDDAGGVQYGEIQSVAGGENPTITLTANPAVQFRGGSSQQCGVRGHGNDFVNVVNIIRYDIMSLNDVTLPGYAAMYRGGPSYEATRRELVREELDVRGAPIAGTRELIAEYAVDLDFSLIVAPGAGLNLSRQTGANVANYAGDPNGLSAGNGPQLIRAVNAWLSVRSQDADRTDTLAVGRAAGAGPNLLRISMNPTNAAAGPYARDRTMQATIPLNNQMRATWQ